MASHLVKILYCILVHGTGLQSITSSPQEAHGITYGFKPPPICVTHAEDYSAILPCLDTVQMFAKT